ncbi:775_t:CDS:2, partial [Paraglomus occultum]
GREKTEIAIEQDKITGDIKAHKAEGNETVIEKADVCTLETEQTDRPTIDAILEVGMKADNKNDFPMEKEIAENGNMVSGNDSKLHLEAIVDGGNAMSITENASVAQTEQSRLGTETQKESDVAKHDALSQDNVEVIEKGSTVANEQAMKQSAFIPHHILLDAMSLVLSDALAQQAQSEQKSQSKTHRQDSSSSSSSSARYQKEIKWREEAVRCIQDMKQELDICRAREKKLIESLMEERNRADGIMVGLLRLLIIVLMSYGIWYVFSLAMVRLPKALKRY